MRRLLALLTACIVIASVNCTAAAAEVVRSGDYVTVDSAYSSDNPRWFLQPDRKLLYLRRGPPRGLNIETFYIEKVDLSSGPEIRGGDRIRIRGINSDFNGGRDPYIMIEGSKSFRVNVTTKHPELGSNDPTILVIEGNRYGIEYGAPFEIHGTEDHWLCGSCTHYDVPVVASAKRDWSDSFKFGKATESMVVDNKTRNPTGPIRQPPKYCFQNCPPPGGAGSGSQSGVTGQPAHGCVVKSLIGPINVWKYRNTCTRAVRATIRRTCHRGSSGADYREVTITVRAGEDYEFNRAQWFGSFCEPPYNTLSEGEVSQVYE